MTTNAAEWGIMCEHTIKHNTEVIWFFQFCRLCVAESHRNFIIIKNCDRDMCWMRHFTVKLNLLCNKDTLNVPKHIFCTNITCCYGYRYMCNIGPIIQVIDQSTNYQSHILVQCLSSSIDLLKQSSRMQLIGFFIMD